MNKKREFGAGAILSLALLLAVCCAALIVMKALRPAMILPRLTFALFIGLSLAALMLERRFFGHTRADYLENGLLAAITFGVMAWAAGLAGLTGAGRAGLAGGVVYALCRLAVRVMDAQLESTGLRHRGAALTLAAALLLLASQSLAGIPVL